MGEPAREKLGQGRQAEVFEYGDRKALKLFYPGTPLHVVEHERNVSRVINEFDLPTARTYELVQYQGRDGIVYERVEGPTLLKVLLADASKMAWVGELSAELHAQMHACRSDRLPSQKDSLERRIRSAQIEEAIRDKALHALGALPESNEVCHGDFHPDNVLLSPRGPVILDWVNATRGNRMADFVFSALILKVAEVPDFIPNADLFNHGRAELFKAYTKTYLQHYSASMQEIVPWIFPVTVARLGDQIPSERSRLLKLISKLLRRVE